MVWGFDQPFYVCLVLQPVKVEPKFGTWCFVAEFRDISERDFCFSGLFIRNPGLETLPVNKMECYNTH